MGGDKEDAAVVAPEYEAEKEEEKRKQ